MGVAGYFIEKRRRGPAGLRQFLIWYAFVWPFAAAGLCAMSSPRLHWLYWVEFAIAVTSYVVQFRSQRRLRRQRADAPDKQDRMWLR